MALACAGACQRGGDDGASGDKTSVAETPAAAPAASAGRSVAPAPWLANASRVVAARVADRVYVVAAGTSFARVFDAAGNRVRDLPAEPGGAQVLEVVDVDGDGVPEIAIGRGRHRDAQTAPASLRVYRQWWADDAAVEIVPLPETSRQQVVWARSRGDGGLWVGSYESKYFVAVTAATRGPDGTWTSERYGTARVASGAVEAAGKLIVARAYGDELDEPGVVVELAADGAQTPLPSVRGARAIARAPGATPIVVYADGWHREYARKAQAFIARAVWTGDAWERSQLALVPGRHGYDKLRVGDVDGDGAADVVASGNGPAVWVPVRGGNYETIGDGEAADAFPFDLNGDGRDEVLIAGPSPGIW